MPIVARAPRIAAAGLGLAVAVSGGTAPAPAAAHDPRTPPRPPGLRHFMEALASVESGGRYDARNRSSGAYGRYQIMPSNWPSWAHIYLDRRNARPTPANQDRVAAGRLSDLYRGLDRWDRVAYWWLTGNRGPRSGWSDYATRYVVRVMVRFRTRVASPLAGERVRVFGNRSIAILYDGSWRITRHEAYTGDRAHASSTRGSSFVIRFTGRSIRLVGPTGPTRGRAAVFLDGRRVAVIDQWSRTFHARRVVFGEDWARSGTHRLEVRVLGTRGRPTVALDRVVVGR